MKQMWQVIGTGSDGTEVGLKLIAESQRMAIDAAAARGVKASRAVMVSDPVPEPTPLPLKPGQSEFFRFGPPDAARAVAIVFYFGGALTGFVGGTRQSTDAFTIAAIVLASGGVFHVLSVLMRILAIMQDRNNL